ncbi:hypothetical protein EDC01DRAFT_781248 [Geopyxis carbonaria]|nr:hypothetical protein EDC01DRAFT_781248 [Geopyxis carbonaria]
MPTRWELRSTLLLFLAAYLLAGVVIGVSALQYGQRVPGKGLFDFAFAFAVSNQQQINKPLTVIGIYNGGLTFTLTRLAMRIKTQIRTRTAKTGISLKDILNTLPESPDVKSAFTGIGLWFSFVAICAAGIGVSCGVVYKQGMFLSSMPVNTVQNYPVQHVTTCSIGKNVSCEVSQFIRYGRALDSIYYGSAHSWGFDKTSTGYRVTVAPVPVVPEGVWASEVTGAVVALVSDYRTATAINGTRRSAKETPLYPPPLELTFHNTSWALQVNEERVVGDIKWCATTCTWNSATDNKGDLRLSKCNINAAHCMKTTDVVLGPLTYAKEHCIQAVGTYWYDRNARIIMNTTRTHLVNSAYILTAIYSGHVFVPNVCPILFEALRKHPDIGPLFDDRKNLEFEVTRNQLTIETNWLMALYIFALLVVGMVCIYSGYIDRHVWMTTWAPVYMCTMGKSERDLVATEVNGGLLEVKSGQMGRFEADRWPCHYTSLLAEE